MRALRQTKIISLPMCGCTLLLLLAAVSFVGIIWVTDYRQGIRWKSTTTPLPENEVQELCIKLDISVNEKPCSSTTVFADEFYPFILDQFEEGQASFSDVENLLAEYQWEYEIAGPLADGSYYFVVSYDLRGDRATALLFFFHEENEILFQTAKFYEGIN